MKLIILKFISLILVCHFSVTGFACPEGSHQTDCDHQALEISVQVKSSAHPSSVFSSVFSSAVEDNSSVPFASHQEKQSPPDCPRCCHSGSNSFLFTMTSFLSMTRAWETGSIYISHQSEMISQIDPQQVYYPPKTQRNT
ncbi:MAG: hypothetical protein ACK5WZ_05255 [Pseudobdellovibrionaceae bacterium]